MGVRLQIKLQAFGAHGARISKQNPISHFFNKSPMICPGRKPYISDLQRRQCVILVWGSASSKLQHLYPNRSSQLSLSGPSFLPLSCILSENRWPSSKGGFTLPLHTVAGDTQPITQLPWRASHSYGLCYQIFDSTTREILVSVEESLSKCHSSSQKLLLPTQLCPAPW